MKIIRANPLPVGRYWCDVPPQYGPAFAVWLARASTPTLTGSPPAVVVEAQEIDHTDWLWILFRVETPIRWDGPGYVTVAPPAVHKRSDVYEAPAVPFIPDAVTGAATEMLEQVEKAATQTAFVVLAGLALVAVIVWRR